MLAGEKRIWGTLQPRLEKLFSGRKDRTAAGDGAEARR